jgi:hypothetical protein
MSATKSRGFEELYDVLDAAVIELVAADKAFHEGFEDEGGSVKETDAAWLNREQAIADVGVAFAAIAAVNWKWEAVKTRKRTAAREAKYRAQA